MAIRRASIAMVVSVLILALVPSVQAKPAPPPSLTFNYTTGVGYVPAAHMPGVWGWKKLDLRREAPRVTFRYVRVEQYTIAFAGTGCSGTQGWSNTVTRSVTASVDEDAHSVQVLGFNLTGLGSPSSTNPPPAVGDPFDCQDGTVSSVVLNSASGELQIRDSAAGFGWVGIHDWSE